MKHLTGIVIIACALATICASHVVTQTQTHTSSVDYAATLLRALRRLLERARAQGVINVVTERECSLVCPITTVCSLQFGFPRCVPVYTRLPILDNSYNQPLLQQLVYGQAGLRGSLAMHGNPNVPLTTVDTSYNGPIDAITKENIDLTTGNITPQKKASVQVNAVDASYHQPLLQQLIYGQGGLRGSLAMHGNLKVPLTTVDTGYNGPINTVTKENIDLTTDNITPRKETSVSVNVAGASYHQPLLQQLIYGQGGLRGSLAMHGNLNVPLTTVNTRYNTPIDTITKEKVDLTADMITPPKKTTVTVNAVDASYDEPISSLANKHTPARGDAGHVAEKTDVPVNTVDLHYNEPIISPTTNGLSDIINALALARGINDNRQTLERTSKSINVDLGFGLNNCGYMPPECRAINNELTTDFKYTFDYTLNRCVRVNVCSSCALLNGARFNLFDSQFDCNRFCQ